jgi:multisubunit Na+/H+ antiporter MnhE subunit
LSDPQDAVNTTGVVLQIVDVADIVMAGAGFTVTNIELEVGRPHFITVAVNVTTVTPGTLFHNTVIDGL